VSIVRPRILAFAFSEASFELIDRWTAGGELPTFKRLQDSGTWGQLQSAIPYVTPLIWSTILTGTNAGRHGVFDFWQRGADGRLAEVDRRSIKQPCLWDMFAASGLRSGFFNVPLTYPPPPIPGFVISGQDAPGAYPDIAEPRALYGQIIKHFGRLPFKEIFPGGRRKDDYLELFDQDAEARGAVLEYLVRTRDEPFTLIYNSATAMAQHYFWSDMSAGSDSPYHDIVLRAFRSMDRLMARVIDAAQGEVQVFAFSETGAGPLRHGVALNAWLARNGLLAPRHVKDVPSRNVLRHARHWAQTALPLTVQRHLNRRLGPLKRWIQHRSELGNIDWRRTRAYAHGKEGSLFVNRAGREPQGIVQPGREYEAVRDEIIERLYELRDPSTDTPPVMRAYRSEELFTGPELAGAPDIIVDWRNGEYMATEQREFSGEIFCERWREYMSWPTSGSHRGNGIFFAAGPGIAKRGRLDALNLLDLAPTLLHAAGAAVPTNLEGRVAREIFTDESGNRGT
jgi:predicted AlkP superfamily phosphohydrolase/phosphomutase